MPVACLATWAHGWLLLRTRWLMVTSLLRRCQPALKTHPWTPLALPAPVAAPRFPSAGDAKPEVIVKVEPEEESFTGCPRGLGDPGAPSHRGGTGEHRDGSGGCGTGGRRGVKCPGSPGAGRGKGPRRTRGVLEQVSPQRARAAGSCPAYPEAQVLQKWVLKHRPGGGLG